MGVFELADDSDLCSRDLFTEMGGSSRSMRLVAWRPCTAQCAPMCSCLCHSLLLCQAWSGPASAFGVGGCWLLPSTGSAGEGCAQAHTKRRKQTRVCCSKAGRSRLFYSLLTGSAQQFLLSLLNAEALQPLASAMAVPAPCCRFSQQADGTVPSHTCLPGGARGFLGKQPTSWPA